MTSNEPFVKKPSSERKPRKAFSGYFLLLLRFFSKEGREINIIQGKTFLVQWIDCPSWIDTLIHGLSSLWEVTYSSRQQNFFLGVGRSSMQMNKDFLQLLLNVLSFLVCVWWFFLPYYSVSNLTFVGWCGSRKKVSLLSLFRPSKAIRAEQKR